jgi:UDP-4-amino-4,6-dideoxy-N-acetyl-beta-L-altrosamine transaminase
MTSNLSLPIPYGKQNITTSDIESVVNVLTSSHLTQGSVHEEFENALAVHLQSQHAVVFNSATSALHIACLTLGLSEGDLLWTSPTTFVASSNCALYCGADIDFVDIDIETGLMSIVALEHKLVEAEKQGKLPKIVVPVHLAGTSCDMKSISLLAQKYNFKVIEDASHAIGGSFLQQPVGCCQFSDISVFSFHPVKIITTGEGGCLSTNSDAIASQAKLLRSHGITKSEIMFSNKSPGSWYYEQQFLGFNYRMSDINAALGLSQLSRLESIVKERHEINAYYQNNLDHPNLAFQRQETSTYSSLHLCIIRLVGHDSSPANHKFLFEGLRNSQILVQLHYLPVHLQPYYQSLGFKKGQFPNSEAFAQSALSIPIFPGLSKQQQDYICDKISDLTNQIYDH